MDGHAHPRVLAVASCGGHWIQLMRLRPAFEGASLSFVSTRRSDRTDVAGERFHAVVDANRTTKVRLLFQLAQIIWIVVLFRPHLVISTGATAGFFACRVAKLIGAKVLWIDSIANADELSFSGRMAGSFADTWLTQWEHLADSDRPGYRGSVL